MTIFFVIRVRNIDSNYHCMTRICNYNGTRHEAIDFIPRLSNNSQKSLLNLGDILGSFQLTDSIHFGDYFGYPF